jgi:hypothetical protein
VNSEAVGDVAAGAVDEERDRTRIFVSEIPEPFDAGAGRIFFDVAD